MNYLYHPARVLLGLLAILLFLAMANSAATQGWIQLDSTNTSPSSSFRRPVYQSSGCAGANFMQPAGSPISTSAGPIFVAVGDFNLDNKPDLVILNRNSNDVTTLLGDGSGGFVQAAGSPVGVGTGPVSVAVGDFNLDGKPDLAVANFGSSNVTILLGGGNGSFTQAPGSPISLGISSFSVAVGDFNRDGKLDLVFVGGFNTVIIMLGNGLGGFSWPVNSPIISGNNPRSIAVGDFNLDDKPDLVVANFGSHNVDILLGDGLGGFSQPVGSPIAVGGFNTIYVAVDDFNLDGKPDLAVVNFGGNDHLIILLGNGLGGFSQTANSPLSTGLNPNSVVVGDFNSDGKPDLAIANGSSSNITIQLGNGMGDFSQPVGSPISVQGSSFVTSKDFNHDAKSDLAVTSFSTNNVIILLNACTASNYRTKV